MLRMKKNVRACKLQTKADIFKNQKPKIEIKIKRKEEEKGALNIMEGALMREKRISIGKDQAENGKAKKPPRINEKSKKDKR